jgi:putative ABC transport system ATP-binding protein
MVGVALAATGKHRHREARTDLRMSENRISPIVQALQLGKQVHNGAINLTILKDVSFAVLPREAVAILGASGSGKSTLLGLLAGLDTPTSGTVRLNGIDIFSLDEDGRAALRAGMVGFVFQSFQLLPALTALENAMLPLELVGNPDARVHAEQILERVGLKQRLYHYPKQLSGGEQQRVAIARAFASKPRLLLADEPTGNLDSATGAQIIELLFTLNQEQGTTLLMVTHDEELSKRCGRLLHLTAGVVRE